MKKTFAVAVLGALILIASCSKTPADEYGARIDRLISQDCHDGVYSQECADLTKARYELAEEIKVDLGNRDQTPNIQNTTSVLRQLQSVWPEFKSRGCLTVPEDATSAYMCKTAAQLIESSTESLSMSIKKIA